MDGAENGSKVQSQLQKVIMAGYRAKELVSQILTFSRESKQELKPIDIKPIAKDALKLMRSTLPSNIEIRLNLQSNCQVNADPSAIHQVLMNLCTNAAQSMQEKGGILAVTLTDIELDSDFCESHPNLTPGPHLNLTVSDNGCGMPAEILERIFDPFFTTKARAEGSGLGLAVVDGIVKSYDGTITVDSAPHKGTSFNIFLPVFETRIAPEETRAQLIPTGTERILFIDDEKVLAELGSQFLDSMGYEVTTRTNSMEALELFKARPDRFDLVITDLTMPNKTGDELAKEMMRIRADIPIILCTGFSDRLDEKEAKAMGIRAFLYKPIIKKEISRKIRIALEQPFDKNR
jgi:CheY-like chemotaxis protein